MSLFILDDAALRALVAAEVARAPQTAVLAALAPVEAARASELRRRPRPPEGSAP